MTKVKASNILVVKNRAMGDSVMGLGTIAYIRSLYPNSKIYYGLPSWIVNLYAKVSIEVDGFVNVDLKSWKDWPRLWSLLKSLNIDLIYEMHQSGRTAKFFKVYSTLNRIPYFFHNHHLKEGTEVKDQGVIKSLIQRDLDGPYSFLSNGDDYPYYHQFVPKVCFLEGSWEQKKRIVFGVVATRKTKMWPISYYLELAKLIINNNPEMEIKIPLSTSKDDLEIKKEIESIGLPKGVEIVHLPLDDLFSYLGESKLYIGNDTGLKHIAVAAGIKTFTFFGPEPPNEWHPYDKDKHPYFYQDGLECRTRIHHYCGLSECESMICLNQISSNEVFDMIKRELNG